VKLNPYWLQIWRIWGSVNHFSPISQRGTQKPVRYSFENNNNILNQPHTEIEFSRNSGGGHDIEMVLSRVRGRIAAKFAISARSFILLFMYLRGNFRGLQGDIETLRKPTY